MVSGMKCYISSDSGGMLVVMVGMRNLEFQVRMKVIVVVIVIVVLSILICLFIFLIIQVGILDCMVVIVFELFVFIFGVVCVFDVVFWFFYDCGIYVVGVDMIVEVVGVIKKMFYDWFGFKEVLVVLYLQYCDVCWCVYVFEYFICCGELGIDCILVVFDVVIVWLDVNSFKGCSVINVCVEIGDVYDGNLVFLEVVCQKVWLFDFFLQLSCEVGVFDVELIVCMMIFLYEGVIVMVGMEMFDQFFEVVRGVVWVVLQQDFVFVGC